MKMMCVIVLAVGLLAFQFASSYVAIYSVNFIGGFGLHTEQMAALAWGYLLLKYEIAGRVKLVMDGGR